MATHIAAPMAAPDADGSAVADVLQQTGFTCWLAGDLDGAERALHAALARYERLDDPGNVAFTRTHLAAVAFHRGELDRASWLAAETLARFTELDFQEGIGWAFDVIGLVELRRGRYERAVDALRNSLEVHRAVGDRWRQASVLDALAAAFLAAADPGRAAELAGLATAIREALGVPVPAQERAAWTDTHAALARLLSDHDRTAAYTRGAASSVVDVIDTLTTPVRAGVVGT